MAFEIPTALIRDLQIRLRKHAGLGSYDPSDPSVPPLPSLAGAGAALDPSAPFRCGRCRAALLRGPQSTICIFCGADRRRDALPESISFKSTLSSRHLLGSLGLDGSEPISLEPETNEPNKNRDAPKEELVLSDLLDLELHLPSDNNEFGTTNSTTPVPFQITPSLNLSAVEMDNLFADKETGVTVPDSSSKQLPPDKNQSTSLQRYLFSGSEDFGHSANLRSSDVTESSVSAKSGGFDESFADWEAEFQSASSESAFDNRTVDLFKDSSNVKAVGPTSNVVSLNQESYVEYDAKKKENRGHVSSSDNWIPDGFWSVMSTKASKTAGELERSSVNRSGDMKNHLDDSVQISDDRNQDDLWPASSKMDSNNTKSVDDDNELFDDWQDFASSGGATLDVSNSQMQPDSGRTLNEQSSRGISGNIQGLDLDDFLVSNALSEVQGVNKCTSNEKESSNTQIRKGNDEFLDDWQDFTHSGTVSTEISNIQAQTRTETTLYDHPSETKSGTFEDMDLGFFLNSDSSSEVKGGQDPTSSKNESNTTRVNNNGDLSEMKSDNFQDMDFGDFLFPDSSSRMQDHHSPTTHKGEPNVTDLNDDDLFGNWHDFTSSIEAPGRSSNSEPQAGVGTSVYEHSVKATNAQDTEFGGFFDFSASFGEQTTQKGSSEGNIMQPIASAFNSTNGIEEIFFPDSTAQRATGTDDHLSWASQQESAESAVDMLLSQMPDLSFMLSNDLTIPQKADISNSNS